MGKELLPSTQVKSFTMHNQELLSKDLPQYDLAEGLMSMYDVKHKHNIQSKHLSIMPPEEGNLVGVDNYAHNGAQAFSLRVAIKENNDIERSQLA